jgi:hypothetical protein
MNVRELDRALRDTGALTTAILHPNREHPPNAAAQEHLLAQLRPRLRDLLHLLTDHAVHPSGNSGSGGADHIPAISGAGPGVQ